MADLDDLLPPSPKALDDLDDLEDDLQNTMDLHLWVACGNSNAVEAEQLLDHGANVDARISDERGYTALMCACCTSATSEAMLTCARLLLDRGADVNLASSQGRTVLMVASVQGSEVLAKLLCSYGANRDAADEDGDTAITIARLGGDEGRDRVADWLEATRLWTTPLHYLEVVTPPRAAALLRDGADPHARAAGDAAAPSPFELAKAMQAAEGGVEAGSAAALVILEVEGWEAENRGLMTAEMRARAEALFGMLGWLMPRFAKGEEVSLKDQWRERVVPRVLRREFVVG